MTKHRARLRRVFTLLLAIMLTLSVFAPLLTIRASASSSPSEVLQDLTKAENFKIENFPNLTLDYLKQVNEDTDKTNDQAHLEVIQIAEGSSGELYLYVYQATDKELDLTASAVLLSTEFTPDGQNINPEIYYLELVSTDSVFDKYVVKDFHVSEEPYRYYNIVTLYRNFNPAIDEVTAGGVIENFELGIGVGQQWCSYYENESIVYEMNTFETVDVNIGYTGSVSFYSGFQFGNILGAFESGDLWFITFNVEDYIVKKIYDAYLTYKIRSKEKFISTGINETEYGEWSEDIPVTLKSEDTATYEGDGIFGKEYTWNKITSSADFISQLEAQDVRITDEAKSHLSQNAWVFAFLQTERKTNNYDIAQSTFSSEVSSVTVIRLHFMDIKGDVYNLGVVSDRVSPDDSPDAFGSGSEIELPEWVQKLLMILSIILLLMIFNTVFPFVKFIFSILLTVIKAIFSIAFYILTLPFRLIRWIWR